MDKIAKNMAYGRTPLQEYVASGVGVGSSLKRGNVGYAEAGGTFAGVNVNKRGRVFPRLAKEHYDNIYHSFMGQADNRVLERMLSRIVKPGSAQWKEYFDKRAGRVTQDSDGRMRYQVIANVEPVMANLSRRKSAQSTERVKKYQLNQVFSDALVRDKYSIHHSLLRDCQLLSVNDPASAAATLQEWMQRRAAPGVQVKVTADHNIMSNASAVRSISAMASLLPPVIGVESEVTGEQLFMRHPGGRWKVVGPLRYANIVRDVYRLCEKSGPQEAIHLYGHETGILRIDAYLDNKCLSPVIEAHVGHPSTLPAEDSVETLSAITADMRASLESRRANVGLVTFEGGKVDGFVASSVRVERRLALVNAHVKTQGSSVRVQGKFPKYEMAVGSDVWAISDKGAYRQWVLRDAQVGERVAVMFHNGKKVCVSDPFTVAAVDGALLYSRGKANVVPGMSGGALVGLKDMALLGIHSGEMVHCLVATAVTEQVYIDVVDYLTRSARTEDDASDVFAMVKARGLEPKLRSLLPSIEALCDDGRHIGTAAVVSPGIVASTADRRSYANAVPLDFPPISTSLWLGRGNNFKAVSNVREARLCEEVFCLGRDKSGFFTSRMTKVKYVAPEGKLFLLECVGDQKFPLVGSLVVALQDMAVLGFLCSAGFAPGDSVAYCVPFPGRGEVSVSRAFDLKRALPSLNPVVWDPEVLDAVFDLGKGSSALVSKGRAVGVVSEQSAVKFWMGSALHTWGFPLNVPPERGRVLTSVEALVGAVAEYEGEDMAKSLISVITEGVDRGQ